MNEPTIAECLDIIRQGGLRGDEGPLIVAAFTLMKHCELDPRISVDDGLQLLDYPGVVAEVGARILYVLTNRNGLGWNHPESGQFITDRSDWAEYLASNSK